MHSVFVLIASLDCVVFCLVLYLAFWVILVSAYCLFWDWNELRTGIMGFSSSLLNVHRSSSLYRRSCQKIKLIFMILNWQQSLFDTRSLYERPLGLPDPFQNQFWLRVPLFSIIWKRASQGYILVNVYIDSSRKLWYLSAYTNVKVYCKKIWLAKWRCLRLRNAHLKQVSLSIIKFFPIVF